MNDHTLTDATFAIVRLYGCLLLVVEDNIAKRIPSPVAANVVQYLKDAICHIYFTNSFDVSNRPSVVSQIIEEMQEL